MLGGTEIAQIHLPQNGMKAKRVECRPDAVTGEIDQPQDDPPAIIKLNIPEIATQL